MLFSRAPEYHEGNPSISHKWFDFRRGGINTLPASVIKTKELFRSIAVALQVRILLSKCRFELLGAEDLVGISTYTICFTMGSFVSMAKPEDLVGISIHSLCCKWRVFV